MGYWKESTHFIKLLIGSLPPVVTCHKGFRGSIKSHISNIETHRTEVGMSYFV